MFTPVNTDRVICVMITYYNLIGGHQGSNESNLFLRNVKTCLSESATWCYKRIEHNMEDKIISSEGKYSTICKKEIKQCSFSIRQVSQLENEAKMV
jgi:hypothetical protein